MEKGLVVCDTNIFIEFYKGNHAIIDELQAIGPGNIALSSVTAGELLYGAINKREMLMIKSDIDSLKVLNLNKHISTGFVDLLMKYSLSHKLGLPDALIAATVMYYDCELYTLNLKDFRYIKGLKLRKV